MEILEAPSPNFGPRRGGATPSLIVLHYTGMESAEAALARLSDPKAEVSAHYLIAPDGALYRLVAEAERAWHAGAGAWGGIDDVNSRSIGIELQNRGKEPFSARQMGALEGLLTDIRSRWPIAPQGVIGHSDMAPERKADPGPRFDWRRLARRGHAVWPTADGTAAPPVPPSEARFQADAARFGYPVGSCTLAAVLDAMRQRFAPHRRGRPLGPKDMADMAWLAEAYPAAP